ncbi:MAG TPA: hypothetical protein VNP89_01415 [Gaiellaceae bacterium]|nr:hypothetical protein [Gaiellaceae bacterium]
MHVNPDLHHQYALDRRQRLRDEAAAHRLVDRVPPRIRIAQSLRRLANRLDAATAPCGHVGNALTQRN